MRSCYFSHYSHITIFNLHVEIIIYLCLYNHRHAKKKIKWENVFTCEEANFMWFHMLEFPTMIIVGFFVPSRYLHLKYYSLWYEYIYLTEGSEYPLPVFSGCRGRIQLPQMKRMTKYKQTIIPGNMGPPYAMIPSYITTFQSSPVRICTHSQKWKRLQRKVRL